MKRYLETFKTLYVEGKDKIEVLEDLRDSLKGNGLRVFLEDILTEDRDIKRIFRGTRLLTADEEAFDLLVDSTTATLDKIEEELPEIFRKALKKEYGEASEEVILKVHALTRLKRKGLRADAIADLLVSKKYELTNEQILALLVTMSKIEEDKVSNLRYIEEYVMKSGKYLFSPAILSSYSYCDRPLLALDFLKKIPAAYTLPGYAGNFFRTEIKRAVFKNLENGKSKADIRKFKDEIDNEDVKSLFNEVVSSNRFDKFEELKPELEVASTQGVQEQKELDKVIENAADYLQNEINRVIEGFENNLRRANSLRQGAKGMFSNLVSGGKLEIKDFELRKLKGRLQKRNEGNIGNAASDYFGHSEKERKRKITQELPYLKENYREEGKVNPSEMNRKILEECQPVS